MRIGVVGATGFIGGHVARILADRGHPVRVFGREAETLERRFPDETFERVSEPFCWRRALSGLDGVVIAIGVLDGPGLEEAHRDLPARIAGAARAEGLAHLVLVSAAGASPSAETAFLRTKALGEAAILAEARPGWTVVRPSLVYGPGGASMAFLAGLAALPLRPAFASGWLRPIAADDLAQAIADLVTRSEPLPNIIEAGGADRVPLDAYLAALGRWLGIRRPGVAIPQGLTGIGARLAQGLRRPLMGPDALLMLRGGADADPATLERLTGRSPSGLAEGLARHPATRADRVLASLGPWPTVLRGSLAILWIGSGCVSLVFADRGLALLRSAGITGPLGESLVIGGSLLDLALGLAGLSGRQPALVASLQAAAIVLFTALATWLVPSAWADPLGQLLKNIPILAATLLVANLSDR